jgi:hypothetical protein
LGIDSGFFKVTASGLGEALGFLSTETDLNRVVSIGCIGFDLRYRAGSGFDYGNRYETIRIVKYLCHTYLFT